MSIVVTYMKVLLSEYLMPVPCQAISKYNYNQILAPVDLMFKKENKLKKTNINSVSNEYY